MDWSYGLLAEKERTLLQRLSVFAGGWTLEAAEVICATDAVDVADIVDLLTQLVDKSLVVVEMHAREARYGMLETVRQYGLDKLEESGDVDDVRRRHRDWYLALAEQAAPELGGPQQALWFARLETEHDNLRAALEWSKVEKDGAGSGLRLTGALRGFWARRGHWREGREWLEAALARSAEAPPSASLGVLLGTTHFARRRGDYGLATTLGQKGLALCRTLGDQESCASFLSALGIVALLQGDYERATALCDETLSLSRELGNKSLVGTALTHLGVAARYRGDYERAMALHSESLALFREIGDKWNIAFALYGLAFVALRQSDYERAARFFTDSVILCKEVGNRWIGEECLEGFARLASATGHYRRAARLFGAAEVLREALGHHRSPTDQAYHDERMASTRSALGDAAFDAASAEGQAMTLEQAIEYALESLGSPPSQATGQEKPKKGTTANLLTAREREVAALVAQGRTNRQIAAKLVVTERTAETHVQNILNKLGFTSRARVAAWAVEQEVHTSAKQ
jgi:non-specific serine/threonine protein kinase